MKKLLSIIVPNYNKQMYISECLESILNQTYENIEVIVIDDLSTDSSLEIIETFANKDTRIRVFPLKKNGGVSRARNIGVKAARGEYITFIDSDDFYFDCNKLKNEMDIIERNQGKCIAYSRRILVDEKSDVISEDSECRYYSGNILNNLLLEKNACCYVQRDYCMPKKDFIAVGGYTEDSNYYEDYDLLLKLVSRLPMYYTGHCGTAYRITTGGLSTTNKSDYAAQFLVPQKIRFKYIRNLPKTEQGIAYVAWYTEQLRLMIRIKLRKIWIMHILKKVNSITNRFEKEK